MRASAPFLTRSGRVRLGWRLSGFLGVALLSGLVLGAVSPGGLVSGSAALLAGSLIAGWLLLGLEGRGPAALGFHLSGETSKEAGLGFGLGVLIGMTVVGGIALTGGVRWVPAPGSAFAWLLQSVAALLFFAIPAAAEEALIRGYPLQAVAEVRGDGVAVLLTSLAFGAAHLANPGSGILEVANVGAAGLLLGAVYVRTLSLWWATGVHLGWNWALGFVADVRVSGLDVVDAPLYDAIATGPDWLGGGAFGPEGSVVATVVFLASAAGVWWSGRLVPGDAALRAGSLMTANRTKD